MRRVLMNECFACPQRGHVTFPPGQRKRTAASKARCGSAKWAIAAWRVRGVSMPKILHQKHMCVKTVVALTGLDPSRFWHLQGGNINQVVHSGFLSDNWQLTTDNCLLAPFGNWQLFLKERFTPLYDGCGHTPRRVLLKRKPSARFVKITKVQGR